MNLDPAFDCQVQRVDSGAAGALIDAGVTVLDVRTPDEFTGLGHVPGAMLLPVDLSASAPAVLDPEAPVLVCCEHAVRSRHTARLLAQAGFAQVYELAGGMADWTGPRAFDATPVTGPSSWLLENADLLAGRRRVLDVACGKGRHALLLAAAGFDVTAVDRDRLVLDRLRRQAERLGLAMRIEIMDLEASPPPLPSQPGALSETYADRPLDVRFDGAPFDLVLVTRYLHRPLIPLLVEAVAPDGLLIYETFLDRQAARGKPTDPAFLLKPGELTTLVQPLKVLRQREGELEGAFLSAIVAQRAAI